MTGSETEGRPLAEAFVATWRRVMTDPRGFFADMPQAGGLGEPTGFLAICAAVSALGHLLVGWGLGGMVWIFAGQVIGAFLAAAVLVIVAQHLFEGRAGFEPTLRVVAYAAAPLVFFWVPFLGVMAWLYVAYLIVRGLEHVQGLDATRAVLTALLGLGALWLLSTVPAGGPAWF
jgi:hypothetical protein